MWVLKLVIENKNSILNQIASKYDLLLSGYPLRVVEEESGYSVIASGTISGEEKNKLAAIEEIKNHPGTKRFEYHNELMMLQLAQPEEVRDVYNPEIIYIDPIQISKQHLQTYKLASWNKELLNKIANIKIEGAKIKILRFRQEPIQNITIQTIAPNLTKKQMEAFRFAHEKGYYEFPRNIELQQLAKKSNLALSTFQAHLRKSERKIMAFFYKFSKKERK